MFEKESDHIEKTGPKEVLWFIALWVLGFVTIIVVGGIIKFVIGT